jgi:hypothetical protein
MTAEDVARDHRLQVPERRKYGDNSKSRPCTGRRSPTFASASLASDERPRAPRAYRAGVTAPSSATRCDVKLHAHRACKRALAGRDNHGDVDAALEHACNVELILRANLRLPRTRASLAAFSSTHTRGRAALEEPRRAADA